MAWKLKANIRGPQGYSVESAAVGGDDHLRVTLSSGAVLDAGDVRGPQGLAGVNAVDNDTAVGGYISTPGASASKTAVLGAIAAAVNLSAAGYSGSPEIVQAPTLVPSPVDSRPLVFPVRPAGALTLDKDQVVGARRNLMQYTEDISNARYNATGSKNPADTITRNGITLARFDFAGFYHSVNTNWSGNGMAPFVAGHRYLMSYYLVGANPIEKFFWMRSLANTSDWGQGKRLCQPNALTRVWSLVEAASPTSVRAIGDPTLGFAGGPSGSFMWVFMGSAENNSLSLYAGGFQIDEVAATSLDGIAGIGDSTMQGASGTKDNSASREWMGYLEGLLNCRTFNRGIGGNKLVDMDARWATDITPLKPSCKYVIIQGGINDIANGATLATVQGAVNSMTTKAKADGFVPVYLTCTPTGSIAANAGYEAIRLQFNDWLKTTFGSVIDIAAIVADPYDAKYLRRTPGGATGWYGDGTHYTKNAKRAIAEFIAAWPGWDLPTPSPYQKIAATSYTPAGGFVVTSPDGTKYRLTVANGGALTAVAV